MNYLRYTLCTVFAGLRMTIKTPSVDKPIRTPSSVRYISAHLYRASYQSGLAPEGLIYYSRSPGAQLAK